MRYHVNPDTGRAGQCSAKTPEACKYSVESGTVVEHYDSKEEARAAYEKANKSKTTTSLKKKPATLTEQEKMEKRRDEYTEGMRTSVAALYQNAEATQVVRRAYQNGLRNVEEYGLEDDLEPLRKQQEELENENKRLRETRKKLRTDYKDVIDFFPPDDLLKIY